MKLIYKILFICFLFVNSTQVHAYDYFNEDSFTVTIQGVNKRNVYVNETASVYLSVVSNSELTYSKVELTYRNINSSSDKMVSVENSDFSLDWNYILIGFNNEDEIGEWKLENVVVYSTNGDKFTYERDLNESFSLADFSLRNTPYITNIVFSPSTVSPGDQVTLSVEISELVNDVHCVSFLPYQELDIVSSCANNGLLLSKEGDTNRFSGTFYIPDNEYNWIYGIYKLVAYTVDNKPIDIVEPLEPKYTIVNGLDTGINLSLDNKYVNTGDTLIFNVGMVERPNAQMLGSLSYYYPDLTIEPLEVSNWIRMNADEDGIFNGKINLLIDDDFPSGLYKLKSFYANHYFTPDPNEKIIDLDTTEQYAFCVNCVQLQAIKFVQNEYILKTINETLQLNLNYSPNDATDKGVIWESSNPTVATVSDGLVKAISEGTTTITAKNLFSNLSTTTTIYVRLPKVEVSSPQITSDVSNNNEGATKEEQKINKQLESKKIYTESIELLERMFSDENTQTIDTNNLIELLRKIYTYNSDFISDLDDKTIQNLLLSLDRNHSEFINIYYTGRVSDAKLNLPIRLSDLMGFLDGNKVSYEFLVDNKINSNDQKILDDFAKENNYLSTSLIYYDITLLSSTDSNLNKLSSFERPITITLPLPSELDLSHEIKFAHLHNGKVELIPVVINDDATFSFSTSSLSTFALLIDKVINDDAVQDLNILSKHQILIIGGVIVLTTILYYFIKRTKNFSN